MRGNSIGYGVAVVKRIALSPLAVLVMHAPAWAAATDPNNSPVIANTSLTMGEIVVTAPATDGSASTSVLSSVDRLEGERVQAENRIDSWQMFQQMPGIQLTSFGQGNESGKLSFRAFNGEGEINAVKLLIDDIPANVNDGNMRYLDVLMPLEVERIEEVRGTNDPRFGLYNIAGNVSAYTRQGGNYRDARVMAGSFGNRSTQLAVGQEGANHAGNLFVGWQESDGYRDHGHKDKYSLSGKWYYTPDEQNYRVGLIARVARQEAEEPGYLTAAEVADDPWQSMPRNATDGGERPMSMVSLHLESSLSDETELAVRTWVNRIDDQRWVTFYSSQQERRSQEQHSGILSTLTWHPQTERLYDLSLQGGISAEYQDNRSNRYATVARQAVTHTRDQSYWLNNQGAWLQARVMPVADLTLVPAYRVDRLQGGFTNELSGVTADINDYGSINQPKLSLIYQLQESSSLYANWGRTFQIGMGAASYKINQQQDLKPSMNTGWETGVRFGDNERLSGRVALWQQLATNEARSKLGDADNDAENIGKTLRQGVDLQLNAALSEQISSWMSWSQQRSRILVADAASPATEGEEIDHVPHFVASAGLDYQPEDRWQIGTSTRGQSNYYLERTNSSGRFGGYWLWDAHLDYAATAEVDLSLQVQNIGDRYYEYVWYWGSADVPTLHAPGERRSVNAAVSVQF